MNIKGIAGEQRAVSQVKGVTLLIAITVLLVAVAGSGFLALSDEAGAEPPQASLTFQFGDDGTYDPSNVPAAYGKNTFSPAGTYNVDNLTIGHDGGDTIDSENLVLRMEGSSFKYIQPNGNLGGSSYEQRRTFDELGAPDEFSAGDSITLTVTMHDIYAMGYAANEFDSASVTVVWQSDQRDSNTVIAEWSGPEA